MPARAARLASRRLAARRPGEDEEEDDDPVLFKVEREPNSFQDLELHKFEEAFGGSSKS